MSASREKKQRQGAGPSQKVTQAQQEQAAYKKKARLYTIIGVVIAVLIVVLLIADTGVFQRGATAATVGNEKLTVSELSYYYYNARQPYASYGLIDTSKSDSAQMYDTENGVTFHDYFLETALSNAQEIAAIYQAAKSAGHTDDEIKADLAAEIASTKESAAANNYSYKSFLKAVFGRNMTAGTYEKLLGQSLLASKYYNEVYDQRSGAIADEALEAYYAEHQDDVDTVTYSYLYFKAEEDDMDGAKEKAEAALNDYNSGTALADIIESSKPTTSNDHATATGISTISSVYRDELLKLGVDEATVVEYENSGYYVVAYHGRERNEEISATIRSIYVAAETTKDGEQTVLPTADAWKAAEDKANEILAQWNSGEKTAESFAALATEYGMSYGGQGSATADRFNENDARADWLYGSEERKPGDTTITRYESSSAYGYYVTYFESWDEAVWQQNVRNTLTGEAMTEWLGLMTSGYPTALASAAKNVG